jgi:hypothetical protein
LSSSARKYTTIVVKKRKGSFQDFG